MGLTRGIEVPNSTLSAPWPEARPIVRLREFDGRWTRRGDLIVERAQIHAASVGHCRAELFRDYGRMFEAGDAPELGEVAYEDLTGRWLQIWLQLPETTANSQSDGGSEALIWTGLIVQPQDEPDNTTAERTPRGRQPLTAGGLDAWLEQIQIGQSWWEIDGTAAALHRLIGFNGEVDSGHGRGNRSSSPDPLERVYMFGGTALWTHEQMLEHVLRMYVQPRGEHGGPGWPIITVGGQVEILRNMTTPVAMADAGNIKELLDRIVPPKLGVDWVPIPTNDGFEIRIFALTSQTVVAAGHELPANPNVYELNLTGAVDVRATFERDQDRLYDRVVVHGKPIVACLSFGYGAENDAEAAWKTSQQEAYQEGAGSGADMQQHQQVRADDRFRDVFQAFRLVPGDWQGGQAAPMVDLAGELVSGAMPRQTLVRKTLDYLPLREGYDYSVNPPAWAGPDGVIPEFRPPLAIIDVPDVGAINVEALSELGYPNCTVRALAYEWGLRIEANPNHALAAGHWEGEYDGFDPDIEGLDYSGLSMTLAIELDYEVQVGGELPPAQQRGMGLTKVIDVPEAELHILAPQTIIGVEADGTLLRSPNELLILRDDRDLLKRVLAGALARFLYEQARASIEYTALRAEQGCLGAILERIEQGGAVHELNAPLTSVLWDFSSRTTRLGTGRARR
jgi:hypothetical protein